MRVADFILKRCKELNNHVFTLVGGGAMYLNDAMGKSGIKYVCTHHEQAAAMAAEAYARITGNPSVCIVTTGPGGTNAVTGVYGAWVDSIPMIFISGQVRTEVMRRDHIRQIGDQEVNIVDIVRPITKFAKVCDDVEMVEYMFELALLHATKGRPGPVWLDIPLDIQRAEFVPSQKPARLDYRVKPYDVVDIVTKIKNAKHPVILAGNGIRLGHAIDEFWSVFNKLCIPAIPSFDARDIGNFHYRAFGIGGVPESNEEIEKADLLLILGCRMNIRQTGYEFGELGKNATKIMVDIDNDELNKHTFKPDIRVQADIKAFLTILNKELDNYKSSGLIPGWIYDPPYTPNFEHVSPYGFVRELNKYTKPGDVVTVANGLPPTVVCQYLDIKKDMRLIMNSGCGAMGYGLPAAIGAAFASNKPVICIEGDGSLQLNIQELATVAYHRLPIKIFVCNNGGYNSIRNTQDAYFDGNYVGADKASGIGFPVLYKIATAYGINYQSIGDDDDMSIIKNILEAREPIICEVFMDPAFKFNKAELFPERKRNERKESQGVTTNN